MKNYDISRLKHKAVVGTLESTPDRNGMYDEVFKPIKEIWYGNYQLSTTQQISITGTAVTINKMIVVRHDNTIETHQDIKIGDELYNVSDINTDDSVNGFDILTLRNYKGRRA